MCCVGSDSEVSIGVGQLDKAPFNKDECQCFNHRRCQTTRRVPFTNSIILLFEQLFRNWYMWVIRGFPEQYTIHNRYWHWQEWFYLSEYRLTELSWWVSVGLTNLRSCYRVCVGSPVSRNVSEKCPPVLPPSTGPRPILRCVVMWANGAPSPEKITLQTFMFIKKRRFNKCPVNFLISVTMQSNWWTLLVLLASNCRYLFSF